MDIQGQGRVLESRAIKMTEIKHIAVGRQIVPSSGEITYSKVEELSESKPLGKGGEGTS